MNHEGNYSEGLQVTVVASFMRRISAAIKPDKLVPASFERGSGNYNALIRTMRRAGKLFAGLVVIMLLASSAYAIAPQSDFQQKGRVQIFRQTLARVFHDWWYARDMAKAKELQGLLAQLRIYSARAKDIEVFHNACRTLRRLKDSASVQPLMEILNHFRPGGPLEGRLNAKTRDQLVQALFETLQEIDSFAPVRTTLEKLQANPHWPNWREKALIPPMKTYVQHRVGEIWYAKPYLQFLGFSQFLILQMEMLRAGEFHEAKEMVYLCWAVFSDNEWKQSLLAVLLSPDAVLYFAGRSYVSGGLTYFDRWMKPESEAWTLRAWDSSNETYLAGDDLISLLCATVAAFRRDIGEVAVREVLEKSMNAVVLPRMEKESRHPEEKMFFYALVYLYVADTQFCGQVNTMQSRLPEFLRTRARGLLHRWGLKKTPVLLAEAAHWADAGNEVAAIQRKKSIAHAYVSAQKLDRMFAPLWLKKVTAAPGSMRQWNHVLAEMPATTISQLTIQMKSFFYRDLRLYAPLLEALLENYGKKDHARLGYYHEAPANPGATQSPFGYKAVVAPYSLMKQMKEVEPDALYLAMFLSMDEREYLHSRDRWRDFDGEFLRDAESGHAMHSLGYIRFYVRDGVLTIVELQSDMYRRFKNWPEKLKMKEHYAWWKKALMREIERYAQAKGITRIRWVNSEYIHKRWEKISPALTVALYKRLPELAGYDPVEQHGVFEGVAFDQIYEKVLDGSLVIPGAARSAASEFIETSL